MNKTRVTLALSCGLAAVAVLAACSSSGSGGSSGSSGSSGVGDSSAGSTPAATSGSTAAAPIPVKVQLGFIPNSQNYAIPHGISDGAYAKAGLKVSYLPGGTGVDPVQVVAAGKADIGVSQEDTLVIAEGKGLKLKVIGAEFGNAALGMLCRNDSGVTTLKDIVGKTVAVKAISAANFQVLLKTNDIDPKSVKIDNVGNNDEATLISGRAACEYADLALNEPQIVAEAGVPNHMLLDADNGVATQDNVYFTTQAYYDKHKDDVLKPWIQTTQSEWATFLSDPTAAANWVLSSKLVDGDNASQELYQAKAMAPFIETAYDKTHGLLALDPTLWAASAKRVFAAKSTASLVDTTQLLDTTLVSPSIS